MHAVGSKWISHWSCEGAINRKKQTKPNHFIDMVGTNQQPLLIEVADATLKFWIYQFQSKSCTPLPWMW